MRQLCKSYRLGRNALNETKTDFCEETKQAELFRVTRFYCLYALYSDLDFSDPKIKSEKIGEDLISDFRRFVDNSAAERGIRPVELLIEMAGTQEKTLTYFVVCKNSENNL